ncbi:MAG: hypothetical protein ACI8RZ_000810 [Myxococcota bacterium]|jgi:hypothetical protein
MIITSPVLLPALITASAMLFGVRGHRRSVERISPAHARSRTWMRQLRARRTTLSGLLVTVERHRREVMEVAIPRNMVALSRLEGANLTALCDAALPRLSEQRSVRLARDISPESRTWIASGVVPAVLLGVSLSERVQEALRGRTVVLTEPDEAILRRLQSAIGSRISTLITDRDALQRQHRANVRRLVELRRILLMETNYRRMSHHPLPGQLTCAGQQVRDHIRSTQALLALASAA